MREGSGRDRRRLWLAFLSVVCFAAISFQSERAVHAEDRVIEQSDDGKFTYTLDGKLVKYLGGTGTAETEVTVPSIIKRYDINDTVVGETIITEIGEECFKGQSSLETIILPDSIQTIGKEAFANTTALRSMVIPTSVKQIGEKAFFESHIENVTIGAGSSAFDVNVFGSCKLLGKVTFLETAQWKEIPSKMFSGCTGLSDIVIPEGVSKIGTEAFSGSGVSVISLPNTLRTILDKAFMNSALKEITFPGSIRRIGDSVFAGTKLTSVYWPGTVPVIGDNTFSGCVGLMEIILPKNIVSIGEWAFDTGGTTAVYNGSMESILQGDSRKDVGAQYLEGYTTLDAYASLNMDSGLNGKITLQGMQSVKAGISYYRETINIIVASGYESSGMQLDGTAIKGDKTTFSFQMPTSACTLTGSITALPSPPPDNGGSGAGGNGDGTPDAGTGDTGNSGNSGNGGNGTGDTGTGDTGTGDAGTEGNPNTGTPGGGAGNSGTGGTPDAGTPDAGTPDAGTGNNGTGGTTDTGTGDTGGGSTQSPETNTGKTLKKGSKIKDKGSKAEYKVTSATGKKTVEYLSSTEKNPSKITIPSKIKYKGITYQVTSVAKNACKKKTKIKKVTIASTVVSIGERAFYGCKELTSISIPKNVKTIGKEAFYGDKKLKTIEIKSTVLKSVGKKAFEGIDKKTQIKVPKKYYSKYKKLLKGKGIKDSMKWKKV